jgi:hypothetical protein
VHERGPTQNFVCHTVRVGLCPVRPGLGRLLLTVSTVLTFADPSAQLDFALVIGKQPLTVSE